MERETVARDIQAEIEPLLPVVRRMARRLAMKAPTVDVDDLTQEACLAMVGCAGRFSSTAGASWKTFALRRASGAMVDYLRRGSWPRRMRRLMREGEAPPEMAHRAGVLKWMTRQRAYVESEPEAGLSSSGGHDVPPELWPVLGGASSFSTDDVEARAAFCLVLRRVAPAWSARERRIVREYFFHDRTMKAIGESLGVTEGRVCQILTRAMAKARAILPK